MGTLFVVATPIGNMDDLSPRAQRVLGEVGLIAAEDTRHTGKLLKRFGITTPMMSNHAFNEQSRVVALLDAIAHGDIALVTDAGTPGISDPGSGLVNAALEAGYAVQSVAGPSALTAAVSISGLSVEPFVFLGFLPRKATARSLVIGRAAATGYGMVIYESAQRLSDTLSDLTAVCSARRFSIVREITKMHEEVFRGILGANESIALPAVLRGEIVLVIESAPPGIDESDVDQLLETLLNAGLKRSDAAREGAALTGRSKSELYERIETLRNKS